MQHPAYSRPLMRMYFTSLPFLESFADPGKEGEGGTREMGAGVATPLSQQTRPRFSGTCGPGMLSLVLTSAQESGVLVSGLPREA